MQLNSSLAVEKENARRQQELNEERLKFYTNITHELRTPLH
ncbi:MAG: cell wall metabolism sensor histidine kinase WalK [Bacteroides sp.]|nr:cell wall metabolism sensor histidine kinase WalK [Bacteroides sp.]